MKKNININFEYNITSPDGIDTIPGINGLENLLKSIKNHTYFCLNTCVNQLGFDTLPSGYDLYVLSFWQEVFDEEWFLKVYNKHSGANFLIFGNLYPQDLEKYSRVQYIKILDWQWSKNQVLPTKINWSDKKYKISSLSYFITEFRYFVTLCLSNKKDMLYSWHNQRRSVSPDAYIFKKTGYPNRDSLLQYKQQLDNVIDIDSFNNHSYVDNLRNASNHPAYVNSVVNCINETIDVSWHPDFGNVPLPYLTEKTWKPIYNGNALIFTSQALTKCMLQEAGFVFEYPWDDSYDNCIGDLDRLESIIETINIIDGMTIESLIKGVKESCEYNQNYFFSKQFDKYISSTNEIAIEKLKKIL